MSRVELFADGKPMGVFDGEISVEIPAETRQLRGLNLDPVDFGAVTIQAGSVKGFMGRYLGINFYDARDRMSCTAAREARRQRRARKLKRGW